MSQLFDIPNVLTPTKSKNKKVFGRYTSAIYNNLNKMYAMDSSFYAFAPRSLLPYYWNVIRTNLFWYRGFFPGIHNNGIYTIASYRVDTTINNPELAVEEVNINKISSTYIGVLGTIETSNLRINS